MRTVVRVMMNNEQYKECAIDVSWYTDLFLSSSDDQHVFIDKQTCAKHYIQDFTNLNITS